MLEILGILALTTALGLTATVWRRVRIRQIARDRLAAPLELIVKEAEREPISTRPFLRRHRILPWLLGLAVMACLYWFVGLSPIFVVTLGIIAALLALQLEAYWASRQAFLMEEQLGDAIDLMVSALHAGAGVLGAMENAAQEVRKPLRPQLEEVLGRIRYGDDPQEVFRALYIRVPFESFRLFASALAVHWEVGGSLAPTLAGVGKIIRDRIEIARRIKSMSTQARVSTITVLCTTYFIALVIWRNDPTRMEKFLSTQLGQILAAGAILLQALGLVWAARVSRMKY